VVVPVVGADGFVVADGSVLVAAGGVVVVAAGAVVVPVGAVVVGDVLVPVVVSVPVGEVVVPVAVPVAVVPVPVVSVGVAVVNVVAVVSVVGVALVAVLPAAARPTPPVEFAPEVAALEPCRFAAGGVFTGVECVCAVESVLVGFVAGDVACLVAWLTVEPTVSAMCATLAFTALAARAGSTATLRPGPAPTAPGRCVLPRAF
jgi:hypothetical protein